MAPLSRLADRFELHERLGAGGMGEVFRARDLERGRDVALKTVPVGDPVALYELKREFRTAAKARHPHLVRLEELVVDGPRCFFTMELVRGAPVDAWVAAAPAPERLARVWSVLAQVSGAIETLHRSGLLHRDLKPANLLVDDAGRLVVLDLGLARAAEPLDAGPLELAGTPAYMAPEQAWGGASAASDWYALGLVLHELAVGELPDGGELTRRLGARAAPAVACGDAGLDALIAALLHPEPASRAGAPDVARALARRGGPAAPDADTPAPGPAAAPAGPARPDVATPPPAPFVGRDADLAALAGRVRAVRSGSGPQVVLVEGPSGSGKTTLVRELARREAARGELLVLAGRCYPGQRVPFSAIDDLVDDVARVLSASPPAEVEPLLPPRVGALRRAFPVLARVAPLRLRAATEAPPAEPRLVRREALAQLGRLLGRLTAAGPTLVWLDDLHWGDAASADALLDLLAAAGPGALGVLAFRPPDEAPSPGVEALLTGAATRPAWTTLRLGRLDAAAARTLAHVFLGDAPAARVDGVVAESAGNPLLLLQLAEFCAAHPAATTLSLRELVRRRLDALVGPARAAVELVSLLDRPARLGTLRRCEPALRADAAGSVWSAGAVYLLKATGDRDVDWVSTYHDAVRAAVRSTLAEARRRDLSRLLARALEDGAGDLAQVCALWERAGEPARVVAAALRAAEAAHLSLRSERERHFLELAAAHEGEPEARAAVRARLAEALAATGRPAEAAGHLVALAGAEPGPSLAVRQLGRAAELLFGSGRLARGMDVLAEALRRVGYRLPRRGAGAVALAVWEQLRLAVARRGARPDDRALRARVEVCWAASASLALYDSVRCFVFQTRHLRLAERLGDPAEVQRALGLRAMFLGLQGGRAPAVARLEARIEALGREQPRAPALRGFLLACRGYREHLSGRFGTATATFEAAEAAFRRDGRQRWERNFARVQRACALVFQGDLVRARRAYAEAAAALTAQGDRESFATLELGTGFVLDLAAGRPDEAARRVEAAVAPWSPEDSLTYRYVAGLARVQVALCRGRPAEALAAAEAGWRETRPMRVFQNVRLIFRWYLGLATLRLPALGARERRRVRAWRRAIAREDTTWGAGLARLLDAGLQARTRRPALAAYLAGRAARAFAAAGMAAHEAQARVLRARLRGDPAGEAAGLGRLAALGVEDAEGWMRLAPPAGGRA